MTWDGIANTWAIVNHNVLKVLKRNHLLSSFSRCKSDKAEPFTYAVSSALHLEN